MFEAEPIFRRIVTAAANHNIPAGRIPTLRPNFPSEAAKLADRRDVLQARQGDPEIAVLNRRIVEEVEAHRRERWRDKLESIDGRQDGGTLWQVIHETEGKSTPTKCQPLTFDGAPVYDAGKCASTS